MSVEKKIFFKENNNSISQLYNDDDIMIVSLDLMHEDGENEHNLNYCNISHETILNSQSTIFNKPISFRYDSNELEDVSDVVEHFYDEKQLFDMRIAGHIPTDSKTQFIKRDNGKTYFNCEAIIQKRLVPQLIDIIKDNNGKMKLSVCFIAYGEQDEETGVFVIDKFKLQEITLLSKNVQEGIEGSGLKVLKFSKNEIEDMNKKYLNFSKKELENKEIGTKDSLKIDATKLMDTEWGSIDKSSLKKRIVEASNFKTIAPKVFLDLQDGWEDGEYTKMKYPVMEIVGGDTLFYNRNALSSAKAYATKNNETEVLEKLKKIYKKFDLEFDNKEKTKSNEKNITNMEKGKMVNITLSNLSSSIWCSISSVKFMEDDWERSKYYVEEIYFMENYAVLRDIEEQDFKKANYSISEDNSVVVDLDNIVKVDKEWVEISEENKNVTKVYSNGDDNETIIENVKNSYVWEKPIDNKKDKELKEEPKEDFEEKYNTLNDKYEKLQNSFSELTVNFSNLTNQIEKLNSELLKYKKSENIENAKKYFEKFSNAINEEDCENIKKSLNNIDEEKDFDIKEFKNTVNDAVFKFAEKFSVDNQKEKLKEKPVMNNFSLDLKKKNKDDLDDVCESLNVKI